MWLSPNGGYTTFPSSESKMVLVPCGKCDACLLARARDWSVRASVEIENPLWKSKALFLTLTVNNEHLEYNYVLNQDKPQGAQLVRTVNPRTLQLFFKRLRKQFPKSKIAYLACGEYGGRKMRPHYHALVYGLSESDFGDFEFLKSSPSGFPLYVSKSLDRLWGQGYCFIGTEVRKEVAGYVARYTFKKRGFSTRGFGYAHEPFQTFSKNIPIANHTKWVQSKDGRLVSRPLTAGIGGNFFYANVVSLLTNNFVRSRDDARVKLPLPRAFLHMADELFPGNKVLYDKLRSIDSYNSESVPARSDSGVFTTLKKSEIPSCNVTEEYGIISGSWVNHLVENNEKEVRRVMDTLKRDESIHDQMEGINYGDD